MAILPLASNANESVNRGQSGGMGSEDMLLRYRPRFHVKQRRTRNPQSIQFMEPYSVSNAPFKKIPTPLHAVIM